MLVARQAAGWDPWLDWAEQAFGARLVVTGGIMPVAQPADAVAALRDAVAGSMRSGWRRCMTCDDPRLAGAGAGGGGGAADGGSGFDLSRIDDDWQAEQWGVDEEAAESAARKRADIGHAGRFLGLCG